MAGSPREAERTGRPPGCEEFIAELDENRERNLAPQKHGRKPKPITNAASPSESPWDRVPDGFEEE